MTVFVRRTSALTLILGALVAWIPQDEDCSAVFPTPTVTPRLPADVLIPSGFSGDPVVFFDDFSWRSFIALSWPAQEGARGQADEQKMLGEAAKNVVWGTFKADHEIFQPNGSPPTPWESFDAISPDRFTAWDGAGHKRVLGGFGLHGSELQIEHYNQAGPFGNEQGTLVDRNRNYLRYEVRVNKPEFDFIRDNKLFLAKNLPTEGQLAFPLGSIEVKAAWRTFTPAELTAGIPSRYYTVDAVLVDPDGTREPSKIGLVGLHVVHRTESRREWIWSSFEHVDLVAGDSSCLVTSDGTSPRENKLQPPVNKGNPPQADPDPVPVRRLKSIRTCTQQVNERYRSHPDVKDTVWRNYQLVMTQWPRIPAANEEEFVANFAKPYPEGAGNPSPTDDAASSIANLSMETTASFQESFSCMRCHFNAGKLRHTEFVWTVALRAWREDPDESRRSLEEVRSLVEGFEAERGR